MAYDPTGQTGEKRKRTSTEIPDTLSAYGPSRRARSPGIPPSTPQPVRANIRSPLVTVNDPLTSIITSLRGYLNLLQNQESLAMSIDKMSVLQNMSDAFERYFNKPVRVISAPNPSISWLDLLLLTTNTPDEQKVLGQSDSAGMKRLIIDNKIFDFDAQDFALLDSNLTPAFLLSQVQPAEEELRTLGVVERTLIDIENHAVEAINEARALREGLGERRQRLTAGPGSLQQMGSFPGAEYSTSTAQYPSTPLSSSKLQQSHSGLRPVTTAAGDRSRSPFTSVQGRYDGHSGFGLEYASGSINQPINVLIPARGQYRSQAQAEGSRFGSSSVGPRVTSAGHPSAGQSPQSSRIMSPFASEELHPYNTRAGSSRVSNISQLMNTQSHPASSQQEYAPAMPSHLSMHEVTPDQVHPPAPPGTRIIPSIPRSTLPEPEVQDPEPFRNAIQDRLKLYEKYEKITPSCDRCRRTSKTCTRLLAACGPCTKKHSKCEWKKVTQEELSQPVLHEVPPQDDSPNMTPRDRRSGAGKLEHMPSLTSVMTISSIGEGTKSAESEKADLEDEGESGPSGRQKTIEPAQSKSVSPAAEAQSGEDTTRSTSEQPGKGSYQDPE